MLNTYDGINKWNSNLYYNYSNYYKYVIFYI